jgi:predicted transcriptional regulator
MIHKMEREPKRGIPARPAKVNAAEDIIERIVSIFTESFMTLTEILQSCNLDFQKFLTV